ncbi:MAG TPA: UDP-N-acetylglucosamine 1-carboxyvinyltransferase [Sporosarcina sp.]|nr:UDP-N-acetylglucosamine 1-carboxyvinyltransferase [Sporosarcina sp.]
MDVYKIQGGNRLQGTIKVNGAKNSAVALVPAAILSNSTVTLEGLPEISDIFTLKTLLEDIGATVSFENGEMMIDSTTIIPMPLPNGEVKKLRASYYLMGAMLGRFKKAAIGLPGGCHLGPRPIDQHIKGFEALGAKVTNEHGVLYLRAEKLTGAKIYLDVASVGATINIMLAAVMAEGITTIENAAKEPEIIDVATLLSNMGAKIIGAGTNVIRIEGVEALNGTRHTIIPDRIEAGTFMIMAAAIGDGITIDNVIPHHLEAVTAKLRECGVTVIEEEEQIHIPKAGPLTGIDVKTLVYPGFPTDLQQPFSVLLTQAEGSSMITDTIYSARFKHIDEIMRMNAQARVDGRSAIIKGKTPLQAATVRASDLRAGAALVIAGLMAEGETEVREIQHVERGYSHIIQKLQALGADIRKVTLVEEANIQH